MGRHANQQKTRHQKQTSTTGNAVDEARNEGDRAKYEDCQQPVLRPVRTQHFHSDVHPVERYARHSPSVAGLIGAMIVISKIESIQSKINSTQFSQLPSLPASELSC
ncbi:hypothetical protein METHP15_280043 [Pseudomonas sp. P15-2025]